MGNVGHNTWFSKQCPTVFVVKNIDPGKKRVRIFQQPINPGETRDLMETDWVSEADIRHSLLKGSLNVKLRAGEIIIVDSNIDLLQFDPCHKEFLESAGITTGLEVENGGGSSFPFIFREGTELIGTIDGINRTFTTPEVFLDGTISDNVLRIKILHNGRRLIKDIDYIISESGGLGTGYDTVEFISFIPQAEPKSRLVADYFAPV